MKTFYTYLHCKPSGDIFYVGKGHGIRAYKFTKRSQHHKNIVAKYGKENIQIFIFPCDSEEQAFADEIQQIAQLRRDGCELCNLTDGGEGTSGMKHSIETRAKISASETGKKISDEVRAKISAANKNPSAETRAKISAAMTGKKNSLGHKPSDETRAKTSASLNGHKVSADARAKMSAAKMGNKNASKGAGNV